MGKKIVASVNDLSDGQIHRVTIGDEIDLLLIRADETIKAFGGRCPHHQAPLADGLLHGTRLVCPWHQAVFDIENGELVEPPALDCLATYAVEVRGDDVLIDIPDDVGSAAQPELAHEDRSADSQTVVIVGAGAAGLAAAQELRRSGYRGRLVMITDDPDTPYDRTLLSKDYLAGEAPPEWLFLKPPTFLLESNIELVQQRIDTIDVRQPHITLPGGVVIEPNGLLLATGSRPRRLSVPGAGLDGVTVLRTKSDSDHLATMAKTAEHVVVVGASFIGMEVAASLTQRGTGTMTVVAPEEEPFEQTLGRRVGALFRRIHEENGVAFKLGRNVEAFDGERRVCSVILDGRESVAADLFVTGVGARPASDAISGIDLEEDGSIAVDELMRVREGVYAAGDIATFPDWRTGEPTRIEHWRTAQQQAVIAARNLTGSSEPFRAVPFFWTMQFGAALGYVGHAPTWEKEIVHGDIDNRDFMVFYVRDGRVLAGAAMGRNNQLNALHELMRLEREPAAEDLLVGELDLQDLLES